MRVPLQQSEILSLQTQIIAWFQKQILLQSRPTTIETKTMMDLLGQALQYYATLIDLEERLLGAPLVSAEKQSAGVSASLPKPITASAELEVAESPQESLDIDYVEDIDSIEDIDDFDEEEFEEEDPIEDEATADREYFSLTYAHRQAVQAGCRLTENVFRDQLRKGATLFGWRKESGLGNRPSYFKD